MKVLVSFGTRPELIKMFPLIHELKKRPGIEVSVLNTGQHKEMLGNLLQFFNLQVNFDLNVLDPNQTLAELTSKIVLGVDRLLKQYSFDLIFVHGDTTTSMAVALAAFYNKVKVAHVEAGLRTHNLQSPWPEEMNRRFNSVLANFHFAPTEEAKQNLLKERIDPKTIQVTGNTVIDALLWTQKKIKKSKLEKEFLRTWPVANRRFILVTCHRRENLELGFEGLCSAIKKLASKHDVEIVFPVHLNPNIRNKVFSNLSGIKNVHLLLPLEYPEFVFFMMKSYLIITDSGGIQEEAPSLKVPVLVTRQTTERPEALESGQVILVGTKDKSIYDAAARILESRETFFKPGSFANPYGDGHASTKIADFIEEQLRAY